MRALRALFVLLPMLAWAGWQPVTTLSPGAAARDLQIVDAGVVLTVSASAVQVWAVSDAGVTEAYRLDGGYIGGGFYAPNCVLGLTGGGALTPTTGCGTTTTAGSGTQWTGFKLLSSPPFSVTVINTGSFDELFSGPGAAPGWVRQTFGNMNTGGSRSLQTRQISGVDYIAITTGDQLTGLHMSVDGGMTAPVAGTRTWRDAAPFLLNGAPAVLGAIADAGAGNPGLVLLRDYRAPVPTILSTPAGLQPRFANSSGLVSMATTTTGIVLAPIPNPAQPFATWVVRSGPDGGVGGKVHCEDRACVSSNDAGVIWLWTNEEAPTVSFVTSVLPDGGIRLSADAGDGDGDPIFVSWDAGPTVALSPVAGSDDGTQIDLELVPACTQVMVGAVVTDGLPGHERGASLLMTPPPVHGALEVASSSNTVPAGGGALSFSAFIDGGCAAINGIVWTTSDGGMGTGPTFSWNPPRTECSADGGLVTITATVTWDGGFPLTTSASQQVFVEPWGPAEAPSFVGGSQDAGTTVDWLSMGLAHQCALSSLFPGTSLHWSYDAGMATVMEIADGLRITAPSSCTSFQVTGTAYRTVDGADAGSPTGSLVVTIREDVPPLDSSSAAFSLSVQGDGGVVFGSFSVDAGCLGQRSLEANVTVFTAGTFVIDGGFFADGGSSWPWGLALPGGCAGGAYDVVADLLEGGQSTGVSAQGSITLPFTQVNIEAQPTTQLDVVCGQGARGTVSLLPANNACGSAGFEWSTAGPVLVTRSGTGESFELQSEALDFSIVGQQLTISWSADAGPGNTDFATQTINFGVQPFLQIAVENLPPLRREEEAMTMRIALRNSTSCAVDGLSVLLPLSGATPIGDSVMIGGAKVSGRATDDGLVIDGVSVAANGESIIELSVRPRLLSTPTAAPVASLNGYVVSTQLIPEKGGAGCGCSTADLSMMLGVLLLFVRRRRA